MTATPGPAAPLPGADSASVAPWWRAIADIGSVVAVLTALLYYFGWVRTRTQARALGFDASVMNLSNTDYILKSVNVLVLPFTLILLAAVAAHAAHQRWIVPQAQHENRAGVIRRLGWVCRWSWAGWAVVAVAMIEAGEPWLQLALSTTVTSAVLCALYGRTLERLVTGHDSWSTPGRVLAYTLLAVAIFLSTERIAQALGREFAADYAGDPRQFVAVTIFSAKDLELDRTGVTELKIDKPESEYPYQYTGLRLMERSGDRYFLITEKADELNRGRVIVLRESDSVRMEFHP